MASEVLLPANEVAGSHGSRGRRVGFRSDQPRAADGRWTAVGDVLGFADGNTCHGTDQVASAAGGSSTTLALMDFGDGDCKWDGGRYVALATSPGRWHPVTGEERLDSDGEFRPPSTYGAPLLSPAEAETTAGYLEELAALAESGCRPRQPTRYERAAQRLQHLLDANAELAAEKVVAGDEEMPLTVRELLTLLRDQKPTATGPDTRRHVAAKASERAGGDTGVVWMDLAGHEGSPKVTVTAVEGDEDPDDDFWRPYTAWHTPEQARELAGKLRTFARAATSRP